ncbi:unnamed protein product, partial [Urochloa humidicola]
LHAPPPIPRLPAPAPKSHPRAPDRRRHGARRHRTHVRLCADPLGHSETTLLSSHPRRRPAPSLNRAARRRSSQSPSRQGLARRRPGDSETLLSSHPRRRPAPSLNRAARRRSSQPPSRQTPLIPTPVLQISRQRTRPPSQAPEGEKASSSGRARLWILEAAAGASYTASVDHKLHRPCSFTSADHDMQQFNNIYGATMQDNHNICRNCCVLIQIGNKYQCGSILTYGDGFCYILTTKICMWHNHNFIITFSDGVERICSGSNVDVKNGNKLSIIFVCARIETVPKKQVTFSDPENMETVVYKLGYIPKSSYKVDGVVTQCAPASSCFRGGNLGNDYNALDIHNDERVNIFYHNCSAGTDIVNGSLVVNGSSEVIGINIKHSLGWTIALRLSAIQDDIRMIFPDTQDKTFAGIQVHLALQGQVKANEANLSRDRAHC